MKTRLWRISYMKSGLYIVIELAVAFVIAMLLLIYVWQEYSFDTFHENSDAIYRVESAFYEEGEKSEQWATSSFGYGVALQQAWPQIDGYTCVGAIHEMEHLVQTDEHVYREERVAYADSAFFRIFSFRLLKGDIGSCLSRQNTVVISAGRALKYFGSTDVLGRSVTVENGYGKQIYKISGVMEDMPENSHLHYDVLLSYTSLPLSIQDHWYIHECYTYILLHDRSLKENIERSFPVIAKTYTTGKVLQNKQWGIRLTPLKDIHLNKRLPYEIEEKGNRKILVIYISVALGILLIGLANYLNIYIMEAVQRSRKVGIRMALGASRMDIRKDFICETVLLFLAAYVLGCGILEILWPYLPFYSVPYVLLICIGLFFIGLGSFLGWYASGYSWKYPIYSILHEAPDRNPLSGTKVSCLVLLQFFIASFLSCFAFVVCKQIAYMQEEEKSIGVEKVYVLKLPPFKQGMEFVVAQLKNRLKEIPFVERLSVSSAVPGEEIASFLSNGLYHDTLFRTQPYEMLCCDTSFLALYGLPLKEGRNFSDESYRSEVVINEAAVQQLGIKNAVGEKLVVECMDTPMTIVGVLKDYHQLSLENPYTPIMMMDWRCLDLIPPCYLSIRFTKRPDSEILEKVRNVWNITFANVEMSGFYETDFYEAQFKDGQILAVVSAGTSLIAFAIACSGLWLLLVRIGNNRMKEIGIRKILGASSLQLFHLLVSKFLYPLLWVVPVAVPCAWGALTVWLDTFAFHIELHLLSFVVPVCVMLLLIILVLYAESRKLIYRNPAEAVCRE